MYTSRKNILTNALEKAQKKMETKINNQIGIDVILLMLLVDHKLWLT